LGRRKLTILALEPYGAGSHMDILNGLKAHSTHDWRVLSMPGRKWKWRMRGAAIEFADRAGRLEGQFDLVFAGDMMSVADWRALSPAALRRLPVVTYFHENQLTYPVRQESERDYQYGFTNITTCLASDEVWFNSEFHRAEFLRAVESLLKRMPDCVPRDVAARIRARSQVMYPGISVSPARHVARRSPRTVLWNHRWEWDKNPEEFFDALFALKKEAVPFRVAVLGEHFRECPQVFGRAEKRLAEESVCWGFVESREEYLKALGRCDVVVSTAFHEFFGVSVLEAVASGCVPLLPRRLSYPELFKDARDKGIFYEPGFLAQRLSDFVTSTETPSRLQAAGLVQGWLWKSRIDEWDEGLAEAAQR